METENWIKFYWKLENFCFSNLCCNSRFSSPELKVSASKWKLYMFPNGYGQHNWVGIYLKRKKDCGPDILTVLYKICLIDREGEHRPDGPHIEKPFEKDKEWGLDKLFKRNDLKSYSDVIKDDTLTVYCEFRIINSGNDSNPTQQPEVGSFAKFRDTKRVCKAMKVLYEESLYSDIALQGSQRRFRLHRCILEQRLPKLLHYLTCCPEKIYKDDDLTHVVLLYAYTGKLDVLGWWNDKTVLEEYGLSEFPERTRQCTDVVIAHTRFVVNKRLLSWKVRLELLNDNDKVASGPIVDEHNEIRFQAFLTKIDDDSWKISITVLSSDDTFVKWRVLLEHDSPWFEEHENLIESRYSTFQCSSVLSVRGGVLYFDREFAQFVDDYFTLKFDFIYPMCDSNPSSSTEYHYDFANCQIFEDTHSLLRSLEAMYSDEVADIIIKVGDSNRTFNVHKCILASRSLVFRNMLNHDMLEKIQNQISMKSPYDCLSDDFFSEVVDKFLLYIYCGKVEAPDETFEECLTSLIDMYLVEE